MKSFLLSILFVAVYSEITQQNSLIDLNLCGWEKLPFGFYGKWTREPANPARPLDITWAPAFDQPGFTKYILNRAGVEKIYYVKFDAEWRDERRWFTLNPKQILLEKRINGQIYEERMTLESSGLYRIEGQDEVQGAFNITLRRI